MKKVKAKEVLVNLPIVLLFDSSEEIADFAHNINQILFGKSKLKTEELGKLGNQFVGLFYINRKDEYTSLRNSFIKLIEQEEFGQLNNSEDYNEIEAPKQQEKHELCLDCDALIMLHQKGLDHCICGEEWEYKCLSQK